MQGKKSLTVREDLAVIHYLPPCRSSVIAV